MLRNEITWSTIFHAPGTVAIICTTNLNWWKMLIEIHNEIISLVPSSLNHFVSSLVSNTQNTQSHRIHTQTIHCTGMVNKSVCQTQGGIVGFYLSSKLNSDLSCNNPSQTDTDSGQNTCFCSIQ